MAGARQPHRRQRMEGARRQRTPASRTAGRGRRAPAGRGRPAARTIAGPATAADEPRRLHSTNDSSAGATEVISLHEWYAKRLGRLSSGQSDLALLSADTMHQASNKYCRTTSITFYLAAVPEPEPASHQLCAQMRQPYLLEEINGGKLNTHQRPHMICAR